MEMRYATKKERESVQRYVDSISKPTGVNFFDLMQSPCEQCTYQNQSWNSDPCYKCGSDNNYAYCQDSDGNLID